MKKILLAILITTINIPIFTQESETNKEQAQSPMDKFVEEKSKEWAYNPFRRTDIEMHFIGRSNPNAFLTRFGLGAMPSLSEAFPAQTGFHADKVSLSMTPQAATEVNIIPFNINSRLKMRIGIGISIELQLLLFEQAYHYYGKNFIMSDIVTVAPYVDLIIDEAWKFRWLPLVHFCSHLFGDVLGDPDINPLDPDFNDMGQESMGFEFYYAKPWVTTYFGTQFSVSKGPYLSVMGNLFSVYAGMDFRIPMWGQLNFLLTTHLGLELNTLNDITRVKEGEIVKMVTRSSSIKVDPSFVIGAGIQIDRYSIVGRYSIYRSRHIGMVSTYEQRAGMDVAIYF